MAQKPSIPKGTRDFSPAEVAKRNYIIQNIKKHFETFGFMPIETPSFENSDTLMGKYGEEGDRLIFKILNSGDYFEKFAQDISESTDFRNTMATRLQNACSEIDEEYGDKIRNRSLKFSEYLKNSFVLNTITFHFNNLLEQYNSRFKNIYSEAVTNFKHHIITWSYKAIEKKRFRNEEASSFISNDVYEFDLSDFPFDALYVEIIKRIGSKDLTPHISEKALRYDLTVPFARYVVMHQNEIDFPFKRYQIQPVWRADRPQKGRFREFYQCDADVVGANSLLQEAEFVQLYDAVFTDLGLKGTTIKINNRKILSGIAEVIGAKHLLVDFTVALDKLDKIGEEKVKAEMMEKGISENAIAKAQSLFEMSGSASKQLAQLKTLLANSEVGMLGVAELEEIISTVGMIGLQSAQLQLDVTLARGLNYYTGAIFEVAAPEGVSMGSIGGGGRYDDLTGIFGLKDVSGVGISFGLDRIYLVLEELGLFPDSLDTSLDVLCLNFGKQEGLEALKLVSSLRKLGLRADLYPMDAKMQKQFKYADKRGVPYVVLLGEQELAEGNFVAKNMRTGDQKAYALDAFAQFAEAVKSDF
ncbi:histidine--tRNA ligase [Flagellimonas baculiformis]|uniref:histidine--tRNA ligase n=1 Tax=Flagellimonas baculiformis TaxID=3067310 RepID=UPI00296F1180|nr:histidine--tRNA ligase [Muricauda sp. D6]